MVSIVDETYNGQFSYLLAEWMSVHDEEFGRLTVSDVAQHDISIFQGMRPMEEDGLSTSTKLYYATTEYHEIPRYDSVEVNGEGDVKWFAKLELLFRFN